MTTTNDGYVHVQDLGKRLLTSEVIEMSQGNDSKKNMMGRCTIWRIHRFCC